MHFIPLLTLPISLPPCAPDHQPGVKAPTPFARPRSSPGHQSTTRYQGSIKAKPPAIKANRASSRHIKARPEMINWGSRQPSTMWSAATCRRFGTGRHVSQFPSTVMPAHSTLLPPTARKIPDPGRVNQTSIKAKNPVIVPHQGSSRQTLYFWTRDGKMPPEIRNPGAGTRAFTCPMPSSRQKPLQSRLIVLHQASSRQTMKFKNPILPSALRSGTADLPIGRAGAAAPPLLNRNAAPATVSAGPYRVARLRKPPIKAKNPLIVPNQGSSRQTPIFAGSNARSFARAPFPPSWDVGGSALGVGCSPFFPFFVLYQASSSLPLENSIFFPGQVWSSVFIE